jgi:hypothetical protein
MRASELEGVPALSHDPPQLLIRQDSVSGLPLGYHNEMPYFERQKVMI